MIPFRGRGILLDIEGTTSSVSFVYDVMFPFVRRELDRYLDAHWGQPALAAACRQIARDASHDNRAADRSWIRGEVLRLMDGDVKATGLKQLQGLIWEDGFKSGEMKAHVYDDVPPALRDWHARGIDIRIYSSGSIQAQKLFFGHTIAGNLLPLLSGHYDTTTGPKKEAESYRTIAADFGLAPSDILFLSDVPAELDAARTAGMQTALVLRPGNAAVPGGHGHAEIAGFADLNLHSEPV
ncbi:MAG TPA: acireductone synthase [Pirellulaceae bacterium]|nr:acireductone synthase [Pirellulaceae bacterium]